MANQYKIWPITSYGFREEECLSFPHNKCMGAIDPWAVARFNCMGLNGRIYVGDY